jgi:hypothetical protein
MRPASRLLHASRLGFVATTALGVLVAAVVPGLVGPNALQDQAAAAAFGNTAPVEKAAIWLSDQLVGGLIHDPGETGGEYYDPSVDAAIDAALAFQQILDYDPVVTEIRTGVVANTHDFAHPVSEVSNVTVGQAFLVGPTAKLASFAYRTGLDPTALGNPDADLIDEIIDSVDLEGANLGRVRDRFVDASPDDAVDFEAGQTDRADVLALAWSLDALIRARDVLPADGQLDAAIIAMIDYLQLQQCDGGVGRYFRANFAADPCDTSPDFARVPSTQVTARIALIIEDLEDDALIQPPLGAMRNQAVSWLQLVQKPSGSFDSNALVTGYAGLALEGSGDWMAAQNAAAWLRGVQWFRPVPCGEEATAQGVGAVALDKTAYEQAKTTGPGPGVGWRRATASALPLLRFTPYVTGPPSLSGPAGFVRAGAWTELEITQADDNERLCVAGPKLVGKSLLVNQSVELIPIVAPPGTMDRVYRLHAIDGTDTAVLRVLDSTTFKVRAKFRSVRRGAKQKIAVAGLAPGERVRIRVNGKTVAKGKANVNGKFKDRFKVKTRKGRAKVTVRGRFDDRTGRTRFKVR